MTQSGARCNTALITSRSVDKRRT